MVSAQPDGQDAVSIAYGEPIDKTTVEGDLATLAKRGQWRLQNVTLRQDKQGGQVLGTTVRCVTRGMVARGATALPLSPLVETFKRFRALRIMFVMLNGQMMPLQGQAPLAQNEFVRIAFVQQRTLYTYDVDVLRSDFETLTLPKPPGAAAAQPPATETGARAALAWGAALMLALAAAAASVLWWRGTRKTRDK